MLMRDYHAVWKKLSLGRQTVKYKCVATNMKMEPSYSILLFSKTEQASNDKLLLKVYLLNFLTAHNKRLALQHNILIPG